MSLLKVIVADLSRVKVVLPGRKLKAADRHGDDPKCLHTRLQKCVHEVMVPKFGCDTGKKDANDRSLSDENLWKDAFLCLDPPVDTLGATRQLALDSAASDPVELFEDLCDPVGKTFHHANDQVAAFLAAKEVLPDKLAPSMDPKKRMRSDNAAPPLNLTRFPALQTFVTDPHLHAVRLLCIVLSFVDAASADT